jgi:hypothetical protein
MIGRMSRLAAAVVHLARIANELLELVRGNFTQSFEARDLGLATELRRTRF